MANKYPQKSQQYPSRPVTAKDTWCYKPTLARGKQIGPEAWGEILTLPNIPSKNLPLDNINGIIVRTKKMEHQFLLQVVPYTRYCSSRKYQLNSSSQPSARSRKKNKKKNKRSRDRLLCLRNLEKHSKNC